MSATTNENENVFNLIKNEWCAISKIESPLSYEEFRDFVYFYTKDREHSYPLESDADKHFMPYLFSAHFSIAYNNFLYSQLASILNGKAIFPHDGLFTHLGDTSERHPLSDLLILQLWRQKNFTAESVVRSFCIGREFQAIQQLRMYVEACQLIFLLLTQRNAIPQFLSNDLKPEEYINLWWKSFSPSKTRERINNQRNRVLDEQKKTGIVTGDIRKILPGGNSKYLGNISNICSDYVHWKKDTLFMHSFDKSKGGFRISGNYDWSNHSKETLILITQTLAGMTIWIEDAISCHVSLFSQAPYNEPKHQLLQYVHSIYDITCFIRGCKFGEIKS